MTKIDCGKQIKSINGGMNSRKKRKQIRESGKKTQLLLADN